MKKITSMLSIFVVLLSMFSSPAYADNDSIDFNKYSDWEVEEISSFPEGIVPIEIKSKEELDNLLSKVYLEDTDILNRFDKEIKPMSSGPYTVRVSSPTNIVTSTVNLYADVNCYHYNSFREITGASNIYTTLTGFTLGHNWVEKYTNYSLLNGGRGIKIWAEGTFEYYIVFEGIGRVMSKDLTVSTNYSVY